MTQQPRFYQVFTFPEGKAKVTVHEFGSGRIAAELLDQSEEQNSESRQELYQATNDVIEMLECLLDDGLTINDEDIK